MGIYCHKLSPLLNPGFPSSLCNVNMSIWLIQAFGSSEHLHTKDPQAKLTSLFKLFIFLEK